MIETLTSGLSTADYFGPFIPAIVFIFLMSLVSEPARQRFNAIFVAGAGAVYMSYGGFGPWEFVYTTVASFIAYKGLNNYRYIALAWFMHTCWDLMHHYWGNPIIEFSPNSSWGCAVCDLVLAAWFWFGAPTVFRRKALAAT